MSKSVKKTGADIGNLATPQSILSALGIPLTSKKSRKSKTLDISIIGTMFYNFIKSTSTAKPKIVIMGKVTSNKKTSVITNNDKEKFKRFSLRKYLRPVRNKKIKANPAKPDDIDFVKVISVDDRFVTPNLRLNPEAVAFLFHIDGCAKNLALYILLRELDYNTGQYKFNQQVVDDFIEYSDQLFSTKYKTDTVKKAHRTLVEQNITSNNSRGIYLINPLFVGGKNESDRRRLILDYSNHLRSKNNADVVKDLYPIFDKKSK